MYFFLLEEPQSIVPESLDRCFPIIQCKCPFGTIWSIDANGCPRCSCKPQCSEPLCPLIKCSNGLATDAKGCKLCKCNCPAVLCDIHCRYGYIKDSEGCNTCRCKPKFPICPPLCRMHCPNGFVRDSNGCRICKCRPFTPVCPPVCLIFCQYGNVLDSNGCPTCRCRDRPEPPVCPPIACPAVACPPGYENNTDRNGCRIGCSCRRIGGGVGFPEIL